jgi:hypothetical protein
MTFARPDGMEREQFRVLVQEVIEWFTPLSPYRDKPPIFEREDVNEWQVPPPLYCIAVSAKRYALYNRVDDGGYRIRKFSSHGVGTWQGRDGYTSPPHVPAPCDSVRKLANGAGERWAYDLWYDAIAAIDSGTVYRDERGVPRYYVNGSPWLNSPAFHRVTISTAEQYRTYRHVEGYGPLASSRCYRRSIGADHATADERARRTDSGGDAARWHQRPLRRPGERPVLWAVRTRVNGPARHTPRRYARHRRREAQDASRMSRTVLRA